MPDHYLKLQLLIRPSGAVPRITIKGIPQERSGFAVPEFYPRLYRYIIKTPISDLDFSSSEARKRARHAMRQFVNKAFWDEDEGKSPAGIPESECERWVFTDPAEDDEDSCFNPQTGDWDERPDDECTNLIVYHKPEDGVASPEHRPFEDDEARDFLVRYTLQIVTRRR